MPALEPTRLSVSDVRKRFGISRATIERLISQGYLTPERIIGKPHGKRYLKPADVEAVFQKSHPPTGTPLDLGAIGDAAYFDAFGVWPKRRHSTSQ